MSTVRRLDKPIISPSFDLSHKQDLVLADGRKICYLRSEVMECSEHKYPNVYIRIHHTEEDGTYHGHKTICLCSKCSLNSDVFLNANSSTIHK